MEEEKKADEDEPSTGVNRGKAAIAFKNISRNLIEMIDNAPNVITAENEGATDVGT